VTEFGFWGQGGTAERLPPKAAVRNCSRPSKGERTRSFDVLTSKPEASMMPEMRTTLTLDDDLAGLLKRRAREFGIPFKEAVNRTIRAGMGEAAASRPYPAPKTISHSFGFRPGIDLDKL